MIRKELDPFEGSGKLELAGRKAEEQMAFYLRRFFGSSVDVDRKSTRLKGSNDPKRIRPI